MFGIWHLLHIFDFSCLLDLQEREWQYRNKSSIIDILLILVLKTTWRQQHIPPTMPRIRRPPEKIHNPILAIWSLVPIASFSLKWSYYNLKFIWHLIFKTQDMEGIRDRKNIATLPGSLKLNWWETSDCFSVKDLNIIQRKFLDGNVYQKRLTVFLKTSRFLDSFSDGNCLWFSATTKKQHLPATNTHKGTYLACTSRASVKYALYPKESLGLGSLASHRNQRHSHHRIPILFPTLPAEQVESMPSAPKNLWA